MEIREGDLTKLVSDFKTIKNGSLVVAWDFDPYDTPFIVVAKKENDKIYSKIKETNSGVIVLDGYRKQSDTVREFVEKLKKELFAKCTYILAVSDPNEHDMKSRDVIASIDELAKEYGAEVEK